MMCGCQGLKEWQLGLAHWKDDERGLLLDLADPVIGAAWEPHISDPGLWRFLKPHLKQTGEGRYYLADPTQRQLLRVGGFTSALQKSWTGPCMQPPSIRTFDPSLSCVCSSAAGMPCRAMIGVPAVLLLPAFA